MTLCVWSYHWNSILFLRCLSEKPIDREYWRCCPSGTLSYGLLQCQRMIQGWRNGVWSWLCHIQPGIYSTCHVHKYFYFKLYFLCFVLFFLNKNCVIQTIHCNPSTLFWLHHLKEHILYYFIDHCSYLHSERCEVYTPIVH